MTDKAQFVSRQFKLAYIEAKNAHEILFRDSYDFENQTKALASIQVALTYVSTIKGICYSDPESLLTDDVEYLIHLFHVYCSEFINNYQTNHSHQWTDIEFNRLSEFYESSIFS